MLLVLGRRQLVKREESEEGAYLTIHRSLQWSIILELSRERDQRWGVYQQAFVLLRRGLPMSSPFQQPEPQKWSGFQELSPQVLSLRNHCLWPKPPVDFPTDFAQMLGGRCTPLLNRPIYPSSAAIQHCLAGPLLMFIDLGTYMWHAGLMNDGAEALGTAEEILDDRGASTTEGLRSDILANLGALSGFSGVSERRESMKRREKALRIRETKIEETSETRLTREDYIRRMNSESDLAFGYLQEERFDDIKHIIERCLRAYRSWGDEDEWPFEYAKYYYLRSFVLASESSYTEALQDSKHALSLISKAAGAQHGMTQLWKFGLANLHYHNKDLQQALTLNKEVLDVRKNICGDFNNFTLESYSTYGALLYYNGRENEAE